MKYFLLLVLLVSCGGARNEEGLSIKEMGKACVEGYIYYYNYGGQHGGGYMSPKFDVNGKLIQCSMEAKVEEE